MSTASLGRDKFDRKMDSLKKAGVIPTNLLSFIDRVHDLEKQIIKSIDINLVELPEFNPIELIAQGAPIVARRDIIIPVQPAEQVAQELLALCNDAGGPMATAAEKFKLAVDEGKIEWESLLNWALEDNSDALEELAPLTPEAPRFATFISYNTLYPFISRQAEKGAEKLPEIVKWQHGHCPVCGSLPLMATLESKEGHRKATCSFCRHEYRVKRVQCLFCLEEEMDKLSYFDTEDMPGFQVHVCTTCNMYLKTADFRSLDKLSVPVLDDLESMILDVAAANKGHVRPTLSAWGF